ncbi:MAG TPA: branched-chain amino acid ABC transporter ATP-binding protein/permease [Actinomycetota bacterium]|nr:branched-chain amino acid ABC transporter ATP-binding protein/permease [Actinomycetota bacterium]
MGFLDEFRAANKDAQAERDRRRALKAWARAHARGAVGRPEGNGDVATMPAEEEKGDRLEAVSGEAAAEQARKPEARFKVVTSPGGIAFSVLLFLLLIWPFALPAFNRSNFLEIQRILVFAIIVMGLNLIAGYTGQLSLGQKIFVLIGGYSVGVLTTEFQSGFLGNHWIALIVATLFGMLFGALLGLPALRVKGAYLSIVTLAFVPIFYVAFNSQFLKGIFNAAQGISDIKTPIGNLARPPERVVTFPFTSRGMTDYDYYIFVVIMFGVLFFLARNIVKSRWGRGMTAVRESEIAAKSSGVRVYKVKVNAFMISAAYASLAGAMLTTFTTGQISPESAAAVHIRDSFVYVVMMIIGGTGTLAGPLVGAASVHAIRQFLIPQVQEAFGLNLLSWTTTILAVLALVSVITAPGGTVGIFNDRRERAKARQRRKQGDAPIARLPEALVRPRVRTTGVTGGDIVMETKEMSKIFGGLRANDKVSIAVKRGSVHSLIGPNGSGKTTFINVVTGVYTPEEGEVWFGGDRIDGKPAFVTVEKGMGRTFQNLQIWRRMTVLENVMVGLHTRAKAGFVANMVRTPLARREEAEIKARAMGLLQFVGLEKWAEVPAGALPYGPQRYLEIARALALDPILCILDEPAAGLNPAEVRDLMGVIRRIKETGITVFVIEHHMDLVMGVSDEISVLDYGKKIAEGTPAEVQANERVIEAYLGAEAVEHAGV